MKNNLASNLFNCSLWLDPCSPALLSNDESTCDFQYDLTHINRKRFGSKKTIIKSQKIRIKHWIKKTFDHFEINDNQIIALGNASLQKYIFYIKS